ncbi:MAG: asparagine--tRNA ligase, partial [Oscillospiraceae bacterium]|nr:asparagine--tRNA ligase [Oscillospiraceae bacterium]
MKLTNIKELYSSAEAFGGKQITVGGWVRTVRDSKVFGFMELNDGSYFKSVQVVIDDKLENFSELVHLNVGSAVVVTGTL